MPEADLRIDVAGALDRVRARRPLIQNITNYVAMTVSANVLLALGASPAMVHALDEVEDFIAISDGLVVNIGTLSPPWVDAMRRAVLAANAARKPWVLDPVGCGATAYRTSTAAELAHFRPTIIRANASEVMSLAGATASGPKGVDSVAGSDEALAAARTLARRTGSVIAVTGVVDYATDGTRDVRVDGGDAMMPLSTALGCSLSAVAAAFAAVNEPMTAAVSALAVFGAAGAQAAQRCRGPGHLAAELCDALHLMDHASLARQTSIRAAA